MRTDEDNQKSVTLNIYIAFKDYSYDLGAINIVCIFTFIPVPTNASLN